VGGIIAKKWRLGSILVESLSYHHCPGDGPDNSREFVSIVALANQLALHLNIGNAGDHFTDSAKMKFLMGEVGVEWSILNDIQGSVPGEIERAKFFLEVVRNG
jgi:hypothetical protein